MLRRIVLIGATGFFGRRLADQLAALEGIELIVTSRSEAQAANLAQTLAAAHTNRQVAGIAFERGDMASMARLAALSPWLVVDASGPFQTAGYGLARTALEMGAHWIDLADARDYVLSFAEALDPIARRQNIVALAGASSTPALSMAVVEDLTRDWRRIDSIDIAIMSCGAGEVGQSVIRAILSYAGRPVATFEEGKQAETTGWGGEQGAR